MTEIRNASERGAKGPERPLDAGLAGGRGFLTPSRGSDRGFLAPVSSESSRSSPGNSSPHQAR